MSLVLAADAAYPFDYSILPPDVPIVLGYLGMPGWTPHIWTEVEVAACRAAGKHWFGIITVPQRELTAGDGRAAANQCLQQLPVHSYEAGWPIFMDIEYSAWRADRQGAHDCAAQWRSDMASRGYRNTHVYGPRDSEFDWKADWTGSRPAALPPGAVGVQYDHALANDRYDISVFDPSIFPTEVFMTGFDQDQLDQLSRLLDSKLDGLFGRLHGDAAGTYTREVQDLADAEAAKTSLAKIQATLDTLAGATQGTLTVGSTSIPATIVISPDGSAQFSTHVQQPAAQQTTQPAATPRPDRAGLLSHPEIDPAGLPAPAAAVRYSPEELNKAHWANQDPATAGSGPAIA